MTPTIPPTTTPTTTPTATPKPTATKKPTSTTVDPSILGSIDLGDKSSTKFGAVDFSKSTFDITGLGLKPTVTGGKTTLTAAELATALHRTAITDPATWAGIQYAMYRANFYGSSTPDIGVWGESDMKGIKGFMEAITVLNDKPQNLPASSFLTSQENSAIHFGGNGVRNQVAKVTVPNTLDLNYISDKAFRNALGRSPTAAESKKFATSYQGDVMAVARSNAATVSAQKAPATKLPSATDVIPDNSMAENLANAQKTSTTQLAPLQSAPDANVAATDFARKQDPTKAGLLGANDAVSSFLKSLGGSGL